MPNRALAVAALALSALVSRPALAGAVADAEYKDSVMRLMADKIKALKDKCGKEIKVDLDLAKLDKAKFGQNPFNIAGPATDGVKDVCTKSPAYKGLVVKQIDAIKFTITDVAGPDLKPSLDGTTLTIPMSGKEKFARDSVAKWVAEKVDAK